MIARRVAVVLALAVGVASLYGSAAGADGTSKGTTTTTTPSTDPSSTTTTAPPESTTTTVPPETTTTLGPPGDPAQGTDGGGEPVPIQSGGLYAGQGSLAQALAVRGTLKIAKATFIASKAAHDQAVALVAELTASLATLSKEASALRGQQAAALRELNEARLQLKARAANAYMRGNLTAAATVLSATDATDYLNRVVLMNTVLGSDHDAIDRFESAKSRVTGNVARLADELVEAQDSLSTARLQEAQTAQDADSAAFDLAVFSKGGTIAIHGFVFPVDNPHDFVDSFGAPRLVGTPNQHWHEGVDIMAPRGTKEFACEAGVLVKVDSNLLGGNSLWIEGASGTYYYYAHLDKYAPGIKQGMAVNAGQLVGYVGNTGDAAGGPTHLHFELHPQGGLAVDPFPLLKVVDDLSRKQEAAQ